MNDSLDQAVHMAEKLCSATAEVLCALPEMDSAATVTDINKLFGVHRQLAWQLRRLAHAEDPVSELQNIPKRNGWTTFVEAAKQTHISPPLVANLINAYDEYEALSMQYASSLDAFAVMLASTREPNRPIITKAYRRQNFRTLERILGMSAKVRYGILLFVRSKTEPDRQDLIRLGSYRGMAIGRQGVTWPCHRRLPKSEGLELRRREDPLDPDGVTVEGLSMIRQFSSCIPDTIKVDSGVDETCYHLSWDTLGRKGSQSFTVGGRFPAAVPIYGEPGEDDFIRAGIEIRMPTELLVYDILVDKTLPRTSNPDVEVNMDHFDPIGLGPTLYNRLEPMEADVTQLRTRQPTCPSVDQYEKILAYAVDASGCTLDDFDKFRYTLDYPVMPSTVAMRWPLPIKT